MNLRARRQRCLDPESLTNDAHQPCCRVVLQAALEINGRVEKSEAVRQRWRDNDAADLRLFDSPHAGADCTQNGCATTTRVARSGGASCVLFLADCFFVFSVAISPFRREEDDR